MSTYILLKKMKKKTMSFLVIHIICKQGKFTTSVYCKPTFSEIFTNFGSFLPYIHNIGMIHTLLYRCFRICSDWTKFHLELVKFMDVWAAVILITLSMIILKHFWIRNRIQKKVINVLKKPLFLALPYLGPLPLQSRTKLRKFLKGILDCCKLQILLKGQNILGNTFYFKDCILKELTSDVLSNFQCGLWNES